MIYDDPYAADFFIHPDTLTNVIQSLTLLIAPI
jgi:hypothetical protein